MDLRQRIWNLMGPERRQAAAEAFWGSSEQKSAHQQVEALLAQRLKARPVFIKRLPIDRKAAYLSREMASSPHLWDAAMTAYHFEGHRSMLTDFLDLLGISHENGYYQASAPTESPSTETLENAVRQLLEKYRKVDVLVYLGALVIQDGVFWANLQPIVERMESHLQTDDGPSTVTTS